ncbi:MAG: hypothetical protein ACRBBV_14975 [Paracoccaceae bacterium]
MVKRIPGPVIWGWGLTVLVAFGAVVLGFGPICEDGVCQTKFAALWAAPPNEIGDTLAGFAGALAFVWIIVTVMLQTEQLKDQKEELELTRKEMKEQREATQDMARSLKAQAEIFEDEKQVRAEARAKDLLEQRMKSTVLLAHEYSSPKWVYEGRYHPLFSPNDTDGVDENISLFEPISSFNGVDVEDAFAHICLTLTTCRNVLFGLISEGRNIRLWPRRPPQLNEIAALFAMIERDLCDLSAADTERMKRVGLDGALFAIGDLSKVKYWAEEIEGTTS